MKLTDAISSEASGEDSKTKPVSRGDSGGPDKPMFNQSEINVLIWCANGKTSFEIGKILSLSEHTINHYINICVKKLSASNRIHAVAKAIKLNIIDMDDIA